MLGHVGAGPQVVGRVTGGGRTLPLRPAVYTFRDAAGRATYVGMSERSVHERIRAHFEERRPWALEAAVIEVEWLPHGTPRSTVLRLEGERIRGLRPAGNRAGNRGWYQRGWVLGVEGVHARVAGVGVPWWWWVRVWWWRVVWRLGRWVRLVPGLVVVDVVLRVLL